MKFFGAAVYMIMVFVENRSAMLQENVKADFFLTFKMTESSTSLFFDEKKIATSIFRPT